MSDRDGDSPGVLCWVDAALQADAEGAAHFYSELFGWERSDQTPRNSRVRYFVCKLRGRDVAAVGSRPADGVPPDWNTYIWVDNVGDVARKVSEAGGRVVLAPFEPYDGGRMAVVADPAGAVGRRRGRCLRYGGGARRWACDSSS
jgi:predicted enzyme related to lactoylglutathione lyase